MQTHKTKEVVMFKSCEIVFVENGVLVVCEMGDVDYSVKKFVFPSLTEALRFLENNAPTVPSA